MIMTRILARPTVGEVHSPTDAYAWYGRALAEGFGIVLPLPQGDPGALDSLMGLFVVFLNKRLERDTFFVVTAGADALPADVAHTKEMLALYPSATMLVEREEGWFEVTESDISNPERLALLGEVIAQATQN